MWLPGVLMAYLPSMLGPILVPVVTNAIEGVNGRHDGGHEVLLELPGGLVCTMTYINTYASRQEPKINRSAAPDASKIPCDVPPDTQLSPNIHAVHCQRNAA